MASRSHNPFATPFPNPFATPARSLVSSRPSSAQYSSADSVRPRRRFKSSRLVGEYEKPWTAHKEKRANWDSYIFYTCVVIAILIGAYLCYRAWTSVPYHEYCLIMDDQFDTIDPDSWNYEIQINGFGTGSFDWTTNDPANAYTDADGLHIVPTLTLDSTNITYDQLINGYTLNLTADGTCTSLEQRVSLETTTTSPCFTQSNSSTGRIINPVRSARLNTAGKKTIQYGRVEVVAQMPTGDWLWPAIWMMPQSSAYGPWPASGEIDIAESRGNSPQAYPMGTNLVTSTLHWGPTPETDAFQLSNGGFAAKRTLYNVGLHTFGLEWSEKYLFTWLDGRLRQVLFMNWANIQGGDMWNYGRFDDVTVNGSVPADPWATGGKNAPFDQEFYLILNVAVGSTNGYFPDGIGSKPWDDGSSNSMRDFWQSNSTWLPTWGSGGDRGMTVRSVKMWQEGSCTSPDS